MLGYQVIKLSKTLYKKLKLSKVIKLSTTLKSNPEVVQSRGSDGLTVALQRVYSVQKSYVVSFMHATAHVVCFEHGQYIQLL